MGFYVFDLPFLTFLVDWTLAILIVTLAVTVIFHYFNGGIQPQRGLLRWHAGEGPSLRAACPHHVGQGRRLRAATVIDDQLQDGFVGRSRLHGHPARLRPDPAGGGVDFHGGDPALQHPPPGWTLPVLAIGISAFVALTVGVVYPALLQTLKVTPAQGLARGAVHPRNSPGHAGRLQRLNDVHVQQLGA